MNKNIKRVGYALATAGLLLPNLAFATPVSAEGEGCFEYNGVAYDAFSTARNAIPDAGGTIKMICDASIGDITYGVGKNITLDLNGYTFSQEASDSREVIRAMDGGTLTIDDTSEAGTGVIISNKFGIRSVAGGAIVINGGTVKSTSSYSVITLADSTLEMNGGSILSPNYRALYVSGNATIEGGEVSAKEVTIEGSDKGIIAVADGTLASADSYVVALFDATLNMTGGKLVARDAFAISGNFTVGPQYVVISGGEIISNAEYAIYIPGDPEGKSTVTISGNPTIKGAGGAIGMNGGSLAISGGTFISDGTIGTRPGDLGNGSNGFHDAVLGLPSAYVDTNVVITGGTFTANGEAELIWTTDTCKALGASGTCDLGLTISGGTFSNELDAAYIAENHDIYQLSDEGPWAVDEFDEDSFNFPETGLFVKKGETLDLSEYIGETARKYVTIGSGDREIATADKLKITGVETGKTFLNINLHNSIYPYEENIEIGVYEIAENKDDEEFEDADTAALKTQLASFLDDVLDGTVKEDEDGRATNGKATIYEVDILKRVLATGATIITDYRQLDLLKLYNDIFEEQDITWTIDDVVKYLVEIASENHGEEAGKTLEAALAGKNLINAFEGHVVITDSEDNAGPLGEINELDSPLKLVFPIAEGYRTAPDGYTRKFFAVRVHYNSDGKIEIEEIPATFDGENAIIENDKFSTFYLAYEDVKNEETNPNTFDRGITTFAVLGGITVPTLVAAAWFLAKKNS